MTTLLDEAVETVRRLPQAEQDEIARTIIRLAQPDDEPEPIEARDLPYVLEGLEQAERREFATDAEIERVFRRFGP